MCDRTPHMTKPDFSLNFTAIGLWNRFFPVKFLKIFRKAFLQWASVLKKISIALVKMNMLL